jgi:asparagine synthase (glutamine-hydrolysing)
MARNLDPQDSSLIMCGFVGIYARRIGSHRDLGSLIELLRHRGPDDEGRYSSTSGRAHLAFRRLAIIDLETGEQPVRNEDGSVVVILNGEIYNYVELTAELKAQGHTFRSRGDAEVIAHLYEDHGDELLQHLQGMFAFILWDERRRRMLIARDHAGIKPVYYSVTPGEIAFASEVKPLLRLPSVSRELNPSALSQYLSFGFSMAPRTIFRDVHKLPAGHKLVIENGEIHVSEFWDIRRPQTVSGSFGEVQQLVLDGLDDAVRLHLRSDVSVGAFLSGGIDSGLIVSRAAHLHPRLKTYTLRFEGGLGDESALAASVAERYGTDHTTFTVASDSMQDLIPRIAWACDEPLGDSGVLPNYVISELARRDGVKVVLNGAGGDELFAGYTYFFRSAVEQRLSRLHIPTRLMANLAGIFDRDVSRKFDRAADYRDNPAAHYTGHVTVWPDDALRSLMNPEWYRADAASVRGEAVSRFHGDLLNAKMYAEVKTYLVDDLMLLLDRMTMIHSLEGRVPFLHRPLMELAMGIPGSLKAPGGQRKGLLRSLAADLLPAPLLDQPKRGFNSPVSQWIRGAFGDQVVALLTEGRSLARPWWNRRTLESFVRSRAARGAQQHRLFLLFILEVFCRVHLDGAWNEPASVPTLQQL